MKLSMTLGQMTVGDQDVESWPRNPMETIAAYLKETHPDIRIWIVQNSNPTEKIATKAWYRADEDGQPSGAPCASITATED